MKRHCPITRRFRRPAVRESCAPTSIREGKAQRLELAPDEGFMQALPDRVTVLVDEAARFDQVDVAKTRERLQAALDRQTDQSAESEAYAREQRIIDYANAQLRLTGHG